MNIPVNKPESDTSSPPVRQGKRLLSFFGRSYAFLSSVKLALVLLIAILVFCIIGVTIYRGARAGEMIFGTLWFNGMLILLVANVAFCFFSRIWGRKVTLISLGMILFHLCFVAMLGGIIYNSLFYFRGLIRLTEGETLLSSDPMSYDYFDHGRFFNFSKLLGKTTLIKMHKGYKVSGEDKHVAYEVAVGEGRSKKQGVIYTTHKLENNGFGYYREKEGYSILIVLEDKTGKELYGAYGPLQSYKQKGDQYLYATGTKEGPAPFAFPPGPIKPLVILQVAYHPSFLKEKEGEAVFKVWELDQVVDERTKPMAEGRVKMGERIKAGDYYLSVKEVRYWVGMTVRHDPGKPIVLASLWVGLSGMVMTFIGRMRKGRGDGKAS